MMVLDSLYGASIIMFRAPQNERQIAQTLNPDNDVSPLGTVSASSAGQRSVLVQVKEA